MSKKYAPLTQAENENPQIKNQLENEENLDLKNS